MSSNELCNVGKLLSLSELWLVHQAGKLNGGPLGSLPVSAFCVNVAWLSEALVFSPAAPKGHQKYVPY